MPWLAFFASLVASTLTVSAGIAMSKTLTEAEIQENLDRVYPLIERAAHPPGRYVDDESNGLPGRRWSGQERWSTRHGDSFVRWWRERPVSIKNATLANGDRVNVQEVGGQSWRYSLSREPRRWLHGTVDIRPEGVTFTPGEQPKYIPPAPTEFPNLEYDLAHDKALRDRLIDADFADALYAYLKNEDFWKVGGDRIWSIGLSRAGGLVANLRGHGDIYTDYYPHGGDRRKHQPAVFEEIAQRLKAPAWRRATAEDKIAAAVFTRRDLDSWEQRPPTAPKDWVAKASPPAKPPAGAVRLIGGRIPGQWTEAERLRDEEIRNQTLEKRLYALAISGRISESEYRGMVGRIRQIP